MSDEVDDLNNLQFGALIDCVPTGMDWLVRSCPVEQIADGIHTHTGPFFAHVYDATTETHAGIGVSFKAYAESPEEAFRDALRAMRKAMVN